MLSHLAFANLIPKSCASGSLNCCRSRVWKWATIFLKCCWPFEIWSLPHGSWGNTPSSLWQLSTEHFLRYLTYLKISYFSWCSFVDICDVCNMLPRHITDFAYNNWLYSLYVFRENHVSYESIVTKFCGRESIFAGNVYFWLVENFLTWVFCNYVISSFLQISRKRCNIGKS